MIVSFGGVATPGRVKHECRILRRSVCRSKFFAGLRCPFAPLCYGHSIRIHFFLTDNDNRNLRAHARCRQEFGERIRMNNRRPWLAILEVMNVIGRSREWIYGHSHRADFCGAKKSGHKLRRIREHNQNAIAPGNAIRTQRVPRAIGECGEFAVGYFARLADDGEAFRVKCCRRFQKISSHIEIFRRFPVHIFF